MSHMFYNCTNLETIGNQISNNIQFISDMSYMFYNCISLKSINLANFIMDNEQKIDSSYMFYNCQQLATIEFSNSNYYLSDMKYMFYNCSKLNQIDNLNYFSSNNCINMSYLFYNCKNLNTINLQTNNFYINDI